MEKCNIINDEMNMEIKNITNSPIPSGNVTSIILNCQMNNSKMQINEHMQNSNCPKYFDNDIDKHIQTLFENGVAKNIEGALENKVNSETYQSLSCPTTSMQSEPSGLNTVMEYSPLKKKTFELIMQGNNDLSSVRDLALASSLQNIEYIDADEEGIEPPLSELSFFKTVKILGLEELLSTFKDSTNLHNQCSKSEVPVKSNLKRKISVQFSNKKNKLKKSGLKFTNITIFYFERSQGFSSIPTKGGSTLGMADLHFYISTIPIDEYECKKIQIEVPKLKIDKVIYHKRSDYKEKAKNMQALTLNQRIELLEDAEIQIELKEENDCAYIRSSRAAAGCDCKDYCDPDVCDCSLSGIECQVDRPNFPCGCSQENCRNVMGRNEFNHNKVRTHFIKTMQKIRLENRGRLSKRKQIPKPKVFVNNTDIKREYIDMVQNQKSF